MTNTFLNEMNNMTKRALSGAVYVALMAGGLFLGQIWFALVCAALMVSGILEFARMTGRDMSVAGSRIITVEDIIGGLLFLCLGLLSSDGSGIASFSFSAFPVMLLIRGITELYAKNENPLKELSISVLMQMYLGFGLASMLLMACKPMLVLLILAVIWSNDTGAYLVGCSLGRHRMFERISPKKSWEGFFGGLVIACGMAMLLAPVFMGADRFAGGGWLKVLGLAIVAVAFSTWGDLLESLMKRSLHIKDSGHIIPGHGGILDRIDSLLLAMPVALVYCAFTDTWSLFR